MVAFSTWQNLHNELIRKAVGGSLFIAPTTAATITAITGTGGALVALPTGFKDAGMMTDEGMQWARSVDLSEITSFGQAQPSRTDVSADTETCAVNFQETNKQTIALFTGASLASLVPDATSGELAIAKPSTPSQRSYRILGIAQDTNNPNGDIYVCKYFPNAVVTDYADQAYAKADAAIQWGVTFRAQLDSTLGYAVKTIIAGPGWLALSAAAGAAGF